MRMITDSAAAVIQQIVASVPVFTPAAIAQSGTASFSISHAVEQVAEDDAGVRS